MGRIHAPGFNLSSLPASPRPQAWPECGQMPVKGQAGAWLSGRKGFEAVACSEAVPGWAEPSSPPAPTCSLGFTDNVYSRCSMVENNKPPVDQRFFRKYKMKCVLLCFN